MTTGRRVQIVAYIAVGAIALTPLQADAVVAVAGELVVDLQGVSLEGVSSTWVNGDTTGDTAGDFSTVGGGGLNVAAAVSDGSTTAPFALDVARSSGNAVVAANMSPASIIGNEARSAEAWVFARDGSGQQTPVGWGGSGNDQDSSFQYSDAGQGLFNGWFNDGAWRLNPEDPIVPIITNEWVHVAWTYDGAAVRGYRNGVLTGVYNTVDSNSSGQNLDTTDGPISVGAGRGGGANPFSGYLSDVRVHTGLLSDSDIVNNFNEGITQLSGPVCDLDGDGACNSVDLGILRSNLFTAGDSSMGDIDRNGYIDWVDWRLMKDDANRVVGAGLNSAGDAAPEPTALAIAMVIAVLSGSRPRVSCCTGA
ncbi:hypothetical protein KOR34_08490 [Posidoniimonas corsicana]|uniref:LamG-like jellyroll fold domain-containing protein n=1 Tax=Posidoniimonas corsicana TaxID=1938618 RepID=A0A5C5VE12_9BACT|nr:LamG domain-containing protein [Posidoniimonas corsicana]TWT35952.1 hypothetical protein KOR34_08490 [Posidoniimonas corsicana]